MMLLCRVEPAQITVGQKMTLTCPALPDVAAPGTVATLVSLAGDEQYALVAVGPLSATAEKIEGAVTSYKIGPHELTSVRIKVGETEAQVAPLKFEVQSVIPGEVQNPTPFPMHGVMRAEIPLWWTLMWVGFALALIVVLLLQGVKLRRKFKARRENLVNNRPLTVSERFWQDLRKLESKGFHQRAEYKAFALELTLILKRGMGGAFKFAAEDMTTEELLMTLQSRHRAFFDQAGGVLDSLLKDLDQIKFAKGNTDAAQCMSLLDRAGRLGHALFDTASVGGGGG